MSKSILFWVIVTFSQPLMACSVCFTNKGNAREAFIWTTGLLTFVPLIMIGTGIFVVRKLLKENPEPDHLSTAINPEEMEELQEDPSKEKAEIS